MRLLRLDHLPGGRSLDLHRRLTVLTGAPPDVVTHLTHLLRSVAAGEPVADEGEVELHGTRLALQGQRFDVAGGPAVDPVLDLAAPAPLRPVRSLGPDPTIHPRRSGGPLVEMREVGSPVVGAGLTSGAAADPPATHHEHDPASRTRRIAADDLVRLRTELRTLSGERAVLERRAEEVRCDLDSFARATLDVAAGQLQALEDRRGAASTEVGADFDGRTTPDERATPDEPDDVDRRAGVLVERIEAIQRSLEEQRMRRSVLRDLLSTASARLDEARSLAEVATPAAPTLDVGAVERLESIRDRILEVERGPDRLDEPDRRDLLVELRSAEAELLDRLGFETYADYVMGAPSLAGLRSAPEPDAARGPRISTLEEEVQLLHHEISLLDDLEQASARAEVVEEAAALLGRPAEVVTRLTDRELAELLGSVRRDQHTRAAPSDPTHLDDGGRLADLDAQAQALRARVAECEARVQRHEHATAELAGLRAGELELRERERDLLVRISDRERLLGLLGATGQEPSEVAPADEPEAEVLRRRVERDTSVAWPIDREWQLLARLGELRSVGAVGSLPLLLSGIDVTASGTPALLHRIASMSELVQVVVVSDDDRLARWVGTLSEDATLVRW
ncbi:MAG: hypothetical protein JST64_09545 [Actinobacteria bacterium]|nr:hypothetical protein [Actinomycetota bacterium]